MPVTVTNWDTIENALVAQVRAASGLPVGKVMWEGQTAPSILMEHLNGAS